MYTVGPSASTAVNNSSASQMLRLDSSLTPLLSPVSTDAVAMPVITMISPICTPKPCGTPSR